MNNPETREEWISMAEYIDRDRFADKIREHLRCSNKGSVTEAAYAAILQDLEGLPIVDVAPVVHGEWVRYKEPQNPYRGNGTSYKCSVCGRTAGHHQVQLYKYCPNCGAKMDGGEKENE